MATMMEFCCVGSFVLALTAAIPASAAESPEVGQTRAGIAACEVTVPAGDYSAVILHFDLPGAPGYEKWTYMGGLRAGKMRMDDRIGLREPGGWVELKDGKLTGTFRRNNSTYGRRLGFVQVTVDAVVKDRAVSGTAQIGDKKGTVSGKVVSEAQLARANAVAKDKNWPSAQGPAGGGCAAQPTGVVTMNSVEEIRAVWRSEETDIGQGMSPLTRFMCGWGDASTLRTSSGCASPIVAGGRLFFKYFIPSPTHQSPELFKDMLPEQPKPKVEPALLDDEADDAKKKEAADAELKRLPSYAREKVYPTVDDVVVCMDAATGKTLWKAVMKGRGINSQHHKAGPYDMSPACGEGKVFALGMSGWLYAFDAATGKPLWEAKLSEAKSIQNLELSTALQVGGGVVVSGFQDVWTGFDVNTGRIAWKSGQRCHSILTKWVQGSQEFFLGAMGANVVCIECKTGKELWKLPMNVLSGGRGLGPGGISVIGDRLVAYRFTGSEREKDLKTFLSVYTLTPAKAEPLWEVEGGCHGGSVPTVVLNKFVFSADLRVIDLVSGNVLGQSKGPIPQNGGFMEAIEDLVLVRVDGTHGGISCGFYKVSPDGGVKSLTGEGEWSPPVGGGTTSYHHPIYYPMVDGRMFLRQYDGIYCWDLRNRRQMEGKAHVVRFSAGDPTPLEGAPVDLAWASGNARSVRIDPGIGDVALSGKTTVRPTETTRYTLTADGPGGPDSSSVEIRILTEVQAFTVSKAEVAAGTEVTLDWRTRNARRVTIAPGLGEVEPIGTRKVAIRAATTFELLAEGHGEPIKTLATVRLLPIIEPKTAPAGRKPGLSARFAPCGNDGRLPDFAKSRTLARSVVPHLAIRPTTKPPTVDDLTMDGLDMDEKVASGFAGSGFVDGVAAVFTGYLRVPVAGAWTFRLESPAESRMWLAEQLVLHRAPTGQQSEAGPDIRALLKQGDYPIRVQYCLPEGRPAVLVFAWQPPDQTVPADVPADAFSHLPDKGKP